ncbi:peptide ABC transporter substrate-binding protein [Candidatus Wolfebacteria bacterium]|nr:peptide ABC transporter substrate-binding protein [Candidatus Wolfebacteria bacterium]
MFLGLIQIFKSFSKKELLTFLASFFILLVSFSLFFVEFIESKTKITPVVGGQYTEGIVGQPSFINPILAISDADRDISEIIFDDLSDFAESYKADQNGKIWHYRLKENLKWHDGEKITSDDIIFTIETIQNPDVYSPLAQNWQGVVATRVSEMEVEFRLPSQYAFFGAILKDLNPIPKHIFAKIPAVNLRLSNYNFEPVGSGPYKFEAFHKKSDGYIDLYSFRRNENYFGHKAYLEKFNFAFFDRDEEMIKSFNSGDIDGMGVSNYRDISKVFFPNKIFSLGENKYYAVFLNSYTHLAFKDRNVRMALNLSTNKDGIVEKIFGKDASPIDGPLVGESLEIDNNVFSGEFSIEKANQILEKSGWILNEENVRSKKIGKDDIKLEFVLTAPDVQFLKETAELIKEDWQKIGVKADIKIISLADINSQIIKTRDYQALVFGNILGEVPDLFSFWHSSEKFYPGLNLALYENKEVDRLIKSVRSDFDFESRKKNLWKIQSLIISDQPAIFLYSPNYLHINKKTLFGFDKRESQYISFQSERLKNVENWYIKTARVFK